MRKSQFGKSTLVFGNCGDDIFTNHKSGKSKVDNSAVVFFL